MASNINPYESPQILESQAETAPGEEDYWRDGKCFVVGLKSSLPPRCVWTNEPATVYLQSVEYLIPRWLRMMGPLGWPLVAVVSRRIVVRVPAGATIMRRHRRLQRIGMALFLVWGPACAAALYFADETPLVAVPMTFALLSILGMWWFTPRRIVLRDIRGDFAWLAGAGVPFLASLPQRPAGRN